MPIRPREVNRSAIQVYGTAGAIAIPWILGAYQYRDSFGALFLVIGAVVGWLLWPKIWESQESPELDALALNAYDLALGRGEPGDPAKAFTIWEAAASAGHLISTHNLAECYERGFGVEQDLEQAKALFQRAADRGSSDSQKALERIGRGEPPPPLPQIPGT